MDISNHDDRSSQSDKVGLVDEDLLYLLADLLDYFFVDGFHFLYLLNGCLYVHSKFFKKK